MKTLARVAKRVGCIEQEPFDPERLTLFSFDGGDKSKGPLPPLFPGFLSTQHAHFPTDRGCPGLDLQRECRDRVCRIKKDIFLRKPIECRTLCQADGGLLATLV